MVESTSLFKLLGALLLWNELGCKLPQPKVRMEPAPREWRRLHQFACQLQNLDVAQAAASPYPLLIMDFSRNGRWAGRYTARELQKLHQGGRKLVVYLSVGEAESYRSYWQPSWRPGRPAWLANPNPEWKENYKVRYWDPAWQAIVFQQAEQLAELGYDGLFLDVVDGWEHWQKKAPQARAQMANLVKRLTRRVRKKHPHMAIFLNGGEGLLKDRELLSLITGLVKEEIFWGYRGDGKMTPSRVTREMNAALSPALKAGKLVLCIDYPSTPQQARRASSRARHHGYLHYSGVRALDRLVPPPPPLRQDSPGRPRS